MDTGGESGRRQQRYGTEWKTKQGYFATQSFTVQVSPPGNRPPFFTSAPSTTATVGQLYSYDADASDPDAGDTLTFSLTVAPSGMAINSSTGLIQWTPASGQVGGNSVTVRVQDQGGQFATQSFTIQVGPPPSLAAGHYI